jgi:hypothetical protein
MLCICQTAKPMLKPMFCGSVYLSNRTTKMVLNNFPTLQKNKKTLRTTQQTNDRKPTITMVYSHREQEGGIQQPFCKSRGLASLIFNSYFYESKMLNSSLVHLMKFSAKNPRPRKVPNR